MGERAADLCTSLRQDVFEKYAHGTLQAGPGSHDISLTSVRPRSPTYVFGRSERVYVKPSEFAHLLSCISLCLSHVTLRNQAELSQM